MSLPGHYARRLGWHRALSAVAVAALIPVWALYGQMPSTFSAQHGFDTGNAGNPSPLALTFKPYLVPGHEYLLSGLEDFATIYYDHLAGVLPWWDYATDDNYIKYPVPGRGGDWSGTVQGRICKALAPDCMYLEGPAGYRDAIAHDAFALIELSRHASLSISTDPVIEQAVERNPAYEMVLRRGNFSVWIDPAYYKRTT
jgi:hypothetical protein